MFTLNKNNSEQKRRAQQFADDLKNPLSERDISDYKESERNAEYVKRKFL